MKGLFSVIFRNGSIKRSLSIFILFFTIFMTGTIFIVSHYYTKKVIIDNYLQKYVLYVHKNFEENINEFLNQINLFSRLITVDKELYNILLDSEIDHDTKQENGNKYVSEILKNSNIVENIVIVSNNGERFEFSKTGAEFEEVDCSFIKTSSSYDTFINNHCARDSSGENYIVIGKKFINFHNSYDLGYLQIYVKESYLYSLYANSSLEESLSFITCDGVTISHSDKAKLNNYLYIPEEFIRPNHLNRSYDDKYVLITPTLETTVANLKMYSLISYKSFFKTFNSFNVNLVLIIFLNIILSLIIAVILSKKLANSIIKLQNKMKKYGAGKDVEFSELKNDELFALEDNFKSMVIKIDDLMAKNEEERRRQRVAELATLQAQINPHFVYNVLDAVAWMAKLHDQPEIDKIISAFALFFRIGLHKGENIITIAEELKHIESYITIEQIRFPNTFEISYKIDERILPLKTIKIILQPLVENSIKHGFSKLKRLGIIKIEGYLEGEFVYFKVIDNGNGLKTNPFDAKKSNETFGGYGVFNIRERIVLEYDTDCGLWFEPTPGGGTTAIIKIKPKP